MTDCPAPRHRDDPVQGEPVWCRPDQARIRARLAELDDLAALYAMSADGHREQGTEPGRGNSCAPSPSPIADDLDELLEFLRSWEDAYRDLPEHQGWPTAKPRRGYLADVRTTTVAWLLDHLAGMLEAPFSEDFGREITHRHSVLSAKAKAGTGRHFKQAPCPWCGLRLLTWTEGDEYVACIAPGCRCRLTMDEYEAHAGVARRNLERAL